MILNHKINKYETPLKAFKTPIFSLSFSIAIAFILFSISACTNTTKPEDTKKFAVEETQVKTDITNDAKVLVATYTTLSSFAKTLGETEA